MNKNILFITLTAGALTIACAFLIPPTPAPTATFVPPTATPVPTYTLVPTDTPIPTDTPEPLPTPTFIILPQQWNGTYAQAGIGKLIITIIFEELNGNEFSGKMFWTGTANFRGAITKISGQYVTDFGDAEEQAKWGNHPDYRDGDRSGTWVKWTETVFVNGGGYTLGGWYYGHIQDDGTMVGIYYLNDEVKSFASSDSWKLKRTK